MISLVGLVVIVVLFIGTGPFFSPEWNKLGINHKKFQPKGQIEASSGDELIRNLTWGNINFIHTTDTHGWLSGHANQKQYNGDWGDFISFTQNLRLLAHSKGQDLLLVDTGDKHDGNGLSDATVPNGNKSLPIFIQQDYDLVTIGNHELYLWENSKLEYEFVIDHYQDNYVSTNVEILIDNEYKPMGQKFKYFETPVNKYRILAFGFLFDFMKANKGTKVTPITEIITDCQWFKDILKQYPEHDLDYVVIVGHIPITHSWKELQELHQFLRSYYPNIVIQYFGGHSHIRDFVVNDFNSTGLESGRFCETVGWLSINNDEKMASKVTKFSRSYIDFNTNSFNHHINNNEPLKTSRGNSVKQLIKSARTELQLDTVLGQVSSNYFMDYVPIHHHKNLYRLITHKVLKTLAGNSTNTVSDQRIVIINTGSIRYDLYKGPYTLDSKYIISPFKNDWVKINLPKSVALKVAPILNRGDYIDLLPRHQQYQVHKSSETHDWLKGTWFSMKQLPFKYPLIIHNFKLSKGYRTHDDFGDTGDDTIHKPVINYPIPNVVQSVQISQSLTDDKVDLVFYDFLTWNILEALTELTDKDYQSEIHFYSDTYLGELLTSYITDYPI